jgi:hypothetical protein
MQLYIGPLAGIEPANPSMHSGAANSNPMSYTESSCRALTDTNVRCMGKYQDFGHHIRIFYVDLPCTWSIVRDCPCML